MNRPTSEQRAPRDSPKAASDEWVNSLTEDHGKAPSLREFLLQFGPDESPDLQSFVFLGRLYEHVTHQNPTAVVRQLEQQHPRLREARTLKRALFGQEASDWWSVPDLELIESILGTRRSIFEPPALELVDRLERLIRRGYVTEIVKARAPSGPRTLRKALLEALIQEATAETLELVARSDRKLGLDLLLARTDLLTNPKLWKGMAPGEAEETMSDLQLTPEIIVAAARGGQFRALLNNMPFGQLLERLAEAGHLKLVRRAAHALPEEAAVGKQRTGSRTRLLLAAADVSPSDLSSLLDSLEQTRRSPDEVWLRSAALALRSARSRDLKETLTVVFGPLHHAITDDRLPRDLWTSLDQVLPRADDPASRLRRFLIDETKEHEWTAQDLERALRDSGPHIDQLRREVDQEDLIGKLVKSALKSLKWLSR